MSKHIDIRYYATYTPAMMGLVEDTAGTLYVGNIRTDNLFWFDNENHEWYTSLYKNFDVAKDKHFEPVELFDNGYVNTDDIFDERTATSIIRRYPREFGFVAEDCMEQN